MVMVKDGLLSQIVLKQSIFCTTNLKCIKIRESNKDIREV